MAVKRPALRAAIVGAGLMGRWHADTVRRIGGRVAAIVDPDPARANALAVTHRGSRTASSLDDAVSDVDVVHICSPTATHASLARLAIDAGRHVLVEKPLAATARETSDLLAAGTRRGVLVCPVHQFLFQDGVTTALGEASRIGPLRHIEMIMCSAGADGQDDAARDRIAIEILPHPLSLLMRVMPAGIGDAEWSTRHPAAGELRALTEVRGATASIVISMSGRPPVNRMMWYGARATVLVDLFHGYRAIEAGTVSRTRKATRPFASSAAVAGSAAANLARRAIGGELAYPGLRRLCKHFYAAAAAGGESPISAGETLSVALAAAALTQRFLDVPHA